MSTDRYGEPWSGATYHGFSRPSPREGVVYGRRRRVEHRRRIPRRALLAGVGGAAFLGLLMGFLARPDLGGGGQASAPMRPAAPVAEQAQIAARVPVEVAPPTIAPAPRSAGPLEVLPPDLASAAARPAPPPITRYADEGSLPMIEAAPRTHRVAATPPAIDAPVPHVAAAPAAQASFDCSAATPGAEQLVCSDPSLAAADRRLARAYRRAIEAGLPIDELRTEQGDWLVIREDAARHSPRAVQNIYEQRIQELNDMADDAG